MYIQHSLPLVTRLEERGKRRRRIA
jgi:hypothetical protein